MSNKYESYLNQLEPFKDTQQEQAVIISHLKGLKGQIDRTDYDVIYEKWEKLRNLIK